MPTEIKMPQLSDTMDQGTILRWFKKEGDKISRGDALAEVATDKADLEVESFFEGTLLKINSAEGTSVKVGEVIAVIGQAGEVVSAPSVSAPVTATPVTTTAPVAVPAAAPTMAAPQVASPTYLNGSSAPTNKTSSERIKISPLAKNIAKDHGVDVSSVSGSGEGGRIVRKDVEKLISNGSSSTTPSSYIAPVNTVAQKSAEVASITLTGGFKTEQLSKMRETIASRMVESVTTSPHFYATAKIEVDSLLKIREVLKADTNKYEGITVTHMITKAVGLSLRKFPRINSKYDNRQIVEPQDVNIGIITALPDGLLIPVVKGADILSLSDIVSETRTMIQRARAGKPKADDLQGGTFSISNIGKAEVEHFTAIINPGQGAILAVSSIQDEAIVKNAQVVAGKVMRVTLSVDHRIIDGVMAGEFLTYLKSLLEEPVLLFA